MMNTQQYAKAGVMIRAGTATGAIHAAMLVTPTATNGYRFQWRPSVDFTMTSTGNQVRSTLDGTAPQYVRLVKSGSSYTAYHSANGSTWTQVGTTQTLTMGASFQIGLALSSHLDGTLNTATFDNVTLTGFTPSGPPAAPTNLGATAGNKQVALSWTASTGATSYTVKRSGVAGGPYTALSPTTTSTTFTDSTVTNGSTYYYVVSATNAAGRVATRASSPPCPPCPRRPGSAPARPAAR
jgi:fibronectin type 3 domain-containing protein